MISLRNCMSVLISAAAVLAPGCRPAPGPDLAGLVPLDRLVADYNANAAKVHRLWARVKIKVTVPSRLGLDYDVWGSTSPMANANGLLLLFKDRKKTGPADFVLIGREAGLELFRTGTSRADGVYYLWNRMGDEAALFWGHNRYAGAPGVEGLPIEPLQILAVLGVCELPADLSRIPAVAMRVDTAPGRSAYVLTYIDRQPITGRLMFRREVRVPLGKNKPLLPDRVNFFDNRGVRVMTARLKRYRPIRLAKAPDGTSRPVMPTDIRISWPDRKAEIHLVLSEMVAGADKGLPEVCNLWDNLPPQIARRIQVDRDRGVPTGGIEH